MTPTDTKEEVILNSSLKTTRNRGKLWFFTFNNYKDNDIDTLKQKFTSAEKYIFQEEEGENKTKHLQGCVKFKNAISFNSMKKIHQSIHWEKCRDWDAAVMYCSKEKTRAGKRYSKGIHFPEEIKDPITIPYPWQQKIIDLLKTEPDDRTIFWIWEKVGKTGKTSLVKHLLLKNQDIYLVAGKNRDIFYGIHQFLENNNLRAVIMDLPRTMEGRVPYSAIEQLKNGLFFNTKYESKMCIFNSPHVIIFANFLPDTYQLSLDRWKILEIKEDKDL